MFFKVVSYRFDDMRDVENDRYFSANINAVSTITTVTDVQGGTKDFHGLHVGGSLITNNALDLKVRVKFSSVNLHYSVNHLYISF